MSLQAADIVDGIFHMPSMPPGRYKAQIISWNEENGQSPTPVIFNVNYGEMAEPHLEIPSLSIVSGRLVDEMRGSPIAQATIQITKTIWRKTRL